MPLAPSINTFLPPQLIGSFAAFIQRRHTLDMSIKFGTHKPYSRMASRTTSGKAVARASREADMAERTSDC